MLGWRTLVISVSTAVLLRSTFYQRGKDWKGQQTFDFYASPWVYLVVGGGVARSEYGHIPVGPRKPGLDHICTHYHYRGGVAWRGCDGIDLSRA